MVHAGQTGLTLAAHYADTDWTLSFMYPALFVTAVGAVVFLLLVPHPSGTTLQKTTKKEASTINV